MKKYLLPCLITLLLGAVGGLLYNFFALGGTGLLLGGNQFPAAPVISAVTVPSVVVTAKPREVGRAALLQRGEEVLAAVEAGDFKALSAYIHPERGVTFTPFGTVEKGDVVLTAQELAGAGESDKKYIWGMSHGMGEKIELTVREYFERYVAGDYGEAPIIGVNHVSCSGNALENVTEAYPEDDFLEYYIPGRDPKNGGLDWSALKLVFAEDQGELKLVGVIHSEWTI